MAATITPPKPIKGKIYTRTEVLELMKERDKFPTTTQIEWVGAKTKQRVVFGINQ